MRIPIIVPALAFGLAALTACGGGKSSTAQNAAQNVVHTAQNAGQSAGNSMGSMMGAQTPPNCGAVKPVWVNMKSHAYHEPGDPLYGNTKHGRYMCPSAAKAAGYHLAGSVAKSAYNQMSSGHHRRQSEMMNNQSSSDQGAPMDQSTP